LTLLALASGCSGKLAHREEGRFAGAVEPGPGTERVEIRVDYGSITVLPADGDAITFDGSTLRAADAADVLARLRSVDLTLHARQDGPVLHLRAPSLPADVDAETARLVLRGIVHCPPRLAVLLRTGLGNLKVEGIAGADLHTAQGDIVVARCTGPARLHTERGEILVDGHRGDLQASSPRGSVRAYVRELGPGGVDAVASAAVEVHLPRASAFSVDAACERGRCRNSFGITIVESESGGTSMHGSAQGGGPLLRLRSEQGPLTVAASD